MKVKTFSAEVAKDPDNLYLSRQEAKGVLLDRQLAYGACSKSGIYLGDHPAPGCQLFRADTRRGSSLLGFGKRGEKAIDEEFQSAGYNIDVHMGPAVGQSILHLYNHIIITRYEGDIENPQGSVRHVLPEKALRS